MNIELAYGYFKKIMKAGQGAARGGKYKNRTWKGDHWEYDYEGSNGKTKKMKLYDPNNPPKEDLKQKTELETFYRNMTKERAEMLDSKDAYDKNQSRKNDPRSDEEIFREKMINERREMLDSSEAYHKDYAKKENKKKRIIDFVSKHSGKKNVLINDALDYLKKHGISESEI